GVEVQFALQVALVAEPGKLVREVLRVGAAVGVQPGRHGAVLQLGLHARMLGDGGDDLGAPNALPVGVVVYPHGLDVGFHEAVADLGLVRDEVLAIDQHARLVPRVDLLDGYPAHDPAVVDAHGEQRLPEAGDVDRAAGERGVHVRVGNGQP